MKLLLASVLLILSGSVISVVGQEQTGNTNSKLDVSSDFLKSNRKTGEILYTGNVIMTYGAFVVKADELRVYGKDEVVEKAVALGKPATFHQAQTEEYEFVSASGNLIEFIDRQGQQSIKISQEARLQQGNLSFNGTEIAVALEEGVVNYIECSKGENQCQMTSSGNEQNPAQVEPELQPTQQPLP